jgi:hypothetical protein
MKKTILSAVRLLVVAAVCIQITFIILDFSGQQNSVNELKHQLKINLSWIFNQS